MQSLQIKRYPPKHPLLKQLIKFFWVLKSDHPVSLNHKLLPVNNIDIILNFSSPITYGFKGQIKQTPKYFFTGIRDQYYDNIQTGKVNMLGISFFPAGLHPFLKIPISEFTNTTIELDDVIHNFNSTLEQKICPNDSSLQQIKMLEEYFLNLIAPGSIQADNVFQVLNAFYSNIDTLDISAFCDWYGIHQRKLERIFNKNIGISPKSFKRLNRFQKVLHQILNKPHVDLTVVAHEMNYYDQAHFIKDFKSFAGCPPSRFMKEKRSIFEIMEY